MGVCVAAWWHWALTAHDYPVNVRQPDTSPVTTDKPLVSELTQPFEEKASIPIIYEEEPIQAYDTVRNPDVNVVVTENRRLAEINRNLNGQLTDTLNWILENFKGKEHIPTHLAAHLQLAGVTDNFLLHEQAKEYLAVSPYEEELVNEALITSRDIMVSVEDELLTMSNPDPDRVVLHIPPYPEEGAMIREQMYDALEHALGEHRLSRFLAVTEDNIDSTFHLFGNAARTITFKHEYYEGEEYPQFVIQNAWITNDEQNRRLVQATEEAVDVLPEDYASYVSWLPLDFWVPVSEP